MALVSGVRSSLNPNAPLFVPAALHQVEDFSPECQHQEEDIDSTADDYGTFDAADMLPDVFHLGFGQELANLDVGLEEPTLLSEAKTDILDVEP
ncbi:hypothetical protein TIFTF001_022848 [Ficus carica]|uniref:Uncharacterized protein n=1 Tax=Ficus carica TaxID=3494 RepID=A0AA88DEW4_FICCA|nr:hypothetical protein TIFTF001_022848 [Ficus carica]